MQWKVYQSRLKRILYHRNIFIRLTFYELGIIVFLALLSAYGFWQQKVILVPPYMQQTLWISPVAVSKEYLAEMSYFLAGLRLNFSPSNISFQRELLLRYVDPSTYLHLRKQMLQESDRIISEHIVSNFYPVDIQVNSQVYIAKIIGDLKMFIGNVALPKRRIVYKLIYQHKNGKLWLYSMQEEKG